MKRHIAEVHQKVKKFKCTKCDKAYFSNRDLNRHSTTHGVISEHKCKICRKVFGHRDYMMKHMRIVHTESKNHKCYICGKTFACKGDMKKHSRVHDDNWFLKCDLCDKSYKHLKALKEHKEAIHEKSDKYKCKICFKVCTRDRTLKAHMKIFHENPGKQVPKRTAKCEFCQIEISRKSYLKVHLANVHEIFGQ